MHRKNDDTGSIEIVWSEGCVCNTAAGLKKQLVERAVTLHHAAESLDIIPNAAASLLAIPSSLYNDVSTGSSSLFFSLSTLCLPPSPGPVGPNILL